MTSPSNSKQNFPECFCEDVEIRTNYKAGKDTLQKLHWHWKLQRKLVYQAQADFQNPSRFAFSSHRVFLPPLSILTSCACTILLQCPGRAFTKNAVLASSLTRGFINAALLESSLEGSPQGQFGKDDILWEGPHTEQGQSEEEGAEIHVATE